MELYKNILSPESIEWLKENYATKSDYFCTRYLHIGYKRLWMLCEEHGLQKEKPTEFEQRREVPPIAKKRFFMQMIMGKDIAKTASSMLKEDLVQRMGSRLVHYGLRNALQGRLSPPYLKTQYNERN